MGFCSAWPYKLHEFFSQRRHKTCWHSHGSSIPHLHQQPRCCSPLWEGKSPGAHTPAPHQGAAAFFRKAGLSITQGFWANRDRRGRSNAWTGGCAKHLAPSWCVLGWETAVGAAAGAKARPRNCTAPRLNSALWGSKTGTGKTELLSKSSIQSKWEGYGDNK